MGIHVWPFDWEQEQIFDSGPEAAAGTAETRDTSPGDTPAAGASGPVDAHARMMAAGLDAAYAALKPAKASIK